ncbi:MAG: NADH-quinone oxidoreductase subunit C [Trichlorobacter sp.]|jgi:NADH-quinone oxidoreductase subunit C
MSDKNRAVEKLQGKFEASILEVKQDRGDWIVTVKKEAIIAVLAFLKKECAFSMLTDVTAVDYLGTLDDRFMMVYQLTSVAHKDRIRIKAPVSEADCRVESATQVFGSANWLEREVFDLFGITFDKHPDLRRILMTPDWVGYPLRKDYPLQGPGREPYKGRLS